MKIKNAILLLSLGLSNGLLANQPMPVIEIYSFQNLLRDYATDFENFTFEVGLRDLEAIKKYFADEEMYDATIDIISSDHYMKEVMTKTYDLLEDDYLEGGKVKNLTINLSDDADELMYLTLTFQETEDGLLIVDYFISEP